MSKLRYVECDSESAKFLHGLKSCYVDTRCQSFEIKASRLGFQVRGIYSILGESISVLVMSVWM